jgi:transposase
LRAALGLLAGAYRLGKRLIRQLAQDLLGLSISTGMIAELERQSAADLEAPVERVREHIRRAAAVHIDETSWRQCRRKAWLWVARSCAATAYTIDGSRGGAVARQILGDTAGRVIISDRFPSYCWIGSRQLCWSHLRREFQAMIDRGGEAAEVGRRLLERSDKLFHWWHRVRDGTMARSTLRGYVDPLRWGFRRDLESGAACPCAKTAATCRELLRDEAHLWRFVRVEGVEPTNNAAERALRHPVLYRKCNGGTDSEVGSRLVERLLSVVATCRQQAISALEYLARCYSACLEGSDPPSLLPVTTTP